MFLLEDYQPFLHAFDDILKRISDIEFDPSGDSNSSYYVRADILNLLFLYSFFMFFDVYYKLKFHKATYLSLLFKFILSFI